MSPLRLPRWTVLLVLPLLAGALLLMHGLDAGTHTTAAALAHVDVESDGHGHHTPGCESCPGTHHLLAACMAIAATAATLRLARRTGCRLAIAVRSVVTPAARFGVRLAELARPPDPGWVRLSVMRC